MREEDEYNIAQLKPSSLLPEQEEHSSQFWYFHTKLLMNVHDCNQYIFVNNHLDKSFQIILFITKAGVYGSVMYQK